MKKYKFFTFSLFFILYTVLSASPKGQSITQENGIWTQPLRQCWTYQSDNLSQTNIASDNELIFTSLLSGGIAAIHSKSGIVQWNTELGGRIVSNLLTDKGSIYILSETQTTDDGKDITSKNSNGSQASIRSIDITSGIVNWSISVLTPNLKAQLFLSENQIVLITENGNLTFINPQSGKIIREYNTGKDISSAYIQDNTVILGNIDKSLITIPLSSNTQPIKESTISEIPSNIFSNGSGTIFWADMKGVLRATSVNSNRLLWTRKFGAGISGILGVSEGLLVTSLDNFLYFIDKDNGNILWKRRLAARITEKPFIRDDISILSAFGDSNALFIELKKGKVVNSISLSDANYFVGNPVYVNNLLIFPTLKGLFAFSNECPKK